MTCDFESSYICGYNVDYESKAKWQAVDVSSISTPGIKNFLHEKDPSKRDCTVILLAMPWLMWAMIYWNGPYMYD